MLPGDGPVDPPTMSDDELFSRALCDLVCKQAKKCQTTNGGGLLLSILAHLQGRQCFDGLDELWQAADFLATKPQPKVNDAIIARLRKLADELETGEWEP